MRFLWPVADALNARQACSASRSQCQSGNGLSISTEDADGSDSQHAQWLPHLD